MRSTRITLGPVPIDAVTQSGAIDAIGTLIERRSGGFVVTPNIDHMVFAHRSPSLRDIYARASLSLADGQPLLWMARLLGTPLPEKVSGSDLLDPLMARAAERAWNVFLFGATEEVSAEAERRLVRKHLGLRVVGRDTSRWSPDDPALPHCSAIVRRIRETGADLVIVALGSPKQEMWMARYAPAITPAVALGLGGSLDFAAGAVSRAPAWVSRAGFEWAYRLAQEPRRLAHRYLVRDAQILPIFAAAWFRAALRPVSPAQ